MSDLLAEATDFLRMINSHGGKTPLRQQAALSMLLQKLDGVARPVMPRYFSPTGCAFTLAEARNVAKKHHDFQQDVLYGYYETKPDIDAEENTRFAFPWNGVWLTNVYGLEWKVAFSNIDREGYASRHIEKTIFTHKAFTVSRKLNLPYVEYEYMGESVSRKTFLLILREHIRCLNREEELGITRDLSKRISGSFAVAAKWLIDNGYPYSNGMTNAEGSVAISNVCLKNINTTEQIRLVNVIGDNTRVLVPASKLRDEASVSNDYYIFDTGDVYINTTDTDYEVVDRHDAALAVMNGEGDDYTTVVPKNIEDRIIHPYWDRTDSNVLSRMSYAMKVRIGAYEKYLISDGSNHVVILNDMVLPIEPEDVVQSAKTDNVSMISRFASMSYVKKNMSSFEGKPLGDWPYGLFDWLSQNGIGKWGCNHGILYVNHEDLTLYKVSSQ